ncbi:MAG: CaiB/BaiF CoA transferase family protein [Dehalococcoidia bacterium]
MGIFDGVRVLEFSPFISGSYCAKLFGDLGAEVIKIEEPGRGDWTRREGPFPGDVPNEEASGLFLNLNTNKQGITLDPATPEGRAVFLRLAQHADVLVDGQRPGQLEALGLAPETLRAANPRLIVARVSPFGQTGPYRDYTAHHLNLFHAGGEGFVMPGGYANDLHPDREPVAGPAHLAECDGGVIAASPIVAALLWREATGEGQVIDISVHEGLLLLSGVEIERFADDGVLDTRRTRNVPGGVVPAQDGYVVLDARADDMWRTMVGVMGDPEWAQAPELTDRVTRSRAYETLRRGMGEWASTRTAEEIYHLTQRAGIATAACYTAEDFFKSKQTEARGFLVEIEHPVAGRLRYPSTPYQFAGIPKREFLPAPTLGQHTASVLTSIGYGDADLQALRAAGAI